MAHQVRLCSPLRLMPTDGAACRAPTSTGPGVATEIRKEAKQVL